MVTFSQESHWRSFVLKHKRTAAKTSAVVYNYAEEFTNNRMSMTSVFLSAKQIHIVTVVNDIKKM